MTRHFPQLGSRIAPIFRQRSSLWWIGMAMILIAGGALNLTGYDHGLPYIENVDEGFILTETYSLRGLYGDGSRTIPGYPPIILWIYQGSQRLVEHLTGDSAVGHPVLVIKYIRFLAGLVNTLTILVIGLTARRLGGDLAGILAAVAWAVMPGVTEQTLTALTESWQVLFITLAVYFTLLALETDSLRWAVLSVLAGLVAVLFKYSAYPALGPGVAVTLWGMRSNWKRWTRALIVQVAAIGLCAAALLLYGATELVAAERPEITTFVRSGFSNVVNVRYGMSLLGTAINQVGLAVPQFTAVLLLGTVAYWKRHMPSQRIAWIVTVGLPLAIAWLVTTYLVYPALATRYTTPATSGLIIIISVSITQIAAAVGGWFRSHLMMAVVSVALAVYWLQPQLQVALFTAYVRTLPRTEAALALWSRDALGHGTILVSRQNWRMFDATWGGHSGPPRTWVNDRKLTDRTLEEWNAIYVYYAQLNEEDLLEVRSTSEGRAYLDQILFLKRFPPETERDRWNGPTMYVYRLWRMQHETDTVFGDKIRLVGFDLSGSEVRPGDVISLSPYWRATTLPSANYHVYTHLTPLDSREVIAQSDGPPAAESRPTNLWDDSQETILGRESQIQVPSDLAPGEYRLILGLYDLSTGQRLSTGDGSDFAMIETIQVMR